MTYNLDLYGTYTIKNVDNFVGPKTEIVIRLDPNRENFEHSFYTKEKELREFFKGDLTIEVDCEFCVLENLDFKYPKMLLIVKEGRICRYFIVDKKNYLIFLPLSNNKKNIVEYGFTDLIYLDKIKNLSFCLEINRNGGNM